MLSRLREEPANKRMSQAILVVGIASLFYLYEFFLRVAPSSMIHELMRDLSANSVSIGTMSGFFFFGYAPMQIPVGVLCDRYSPKFLLICAVFLCSFATLVFSYTQSIHVASITRFCIGLASAFAFVGPLVLASHWFEEKHMATVAGVIQFVGCLGAVFAGGPIAKLVEVFGWRQVMFYSAIIGIVLAIVFKFFLHNSPNKHVDSKSEHKMPVLKQLKEVCCNSKTWWLGVVAFCCWAPISIFAELWGASFLSTVYQVNTVQAASAATWIWVGVAISSVLSGIWSSKIQSRRAPILILNVIGLIASIGVIFYHPTSWLEIDFFLFLLGVAAGVQPITFAIACEQTPPKNHGAAMGFNNMAVIFGGVIFQPLVGFLLTVFWDHKMFDDAPIYSVGAYEHAMVVIPLCYILGFVVTYFKITETHCKPYYSN